MSADDVAGGQAEARLRQTLIADIRTLVECESPSHDLDAVARSAEVVARLGADRLGEEPEWIVIDGRTHLRWQFGSATRVVVLGHHDTVWPVGTLARLPFAVEDGVLTGPGCFDMKAGVVMAITAIAALSDRDGVTLLITGDEEPGSPTSRGLIEETARGARAALVLEASADGGALKLERKGVSLYEVVVDGVAAHAGLEPEKGANATIELAHQIIAIAALADADAGTSVTPTVAHSGSTANTVPASASLAVDVRARSAAEQQRVDVAIRGLSAVVPGTRVSLRGGVNRPPLEASSSAELFARAQQLVTRHGGAPLAGTAVGGASDGNFTAGIGVPTLDGLGAVGGGAHAESEHVLIDELVPRTRLLAELIASLLADQAADAASS